MWRMRDNVLLDLRLDALGISQNELARRVPISKAHMSKVRRQQCRAEHDVAERIAELLGVPMAALFEPSLPPSRQPAYDYPPPGIYSRRRLKPKEPAEKESA